MSWARVLRDIAQTKPVSDCYACFDIARKTLYTQIYRMKQPIIRGRNGFYEEASRTSWPGLTWRRAFPELSTTCHVTNDAAFLKYLSYLQRKVIFTYTQASAFLKKPWKNILFIAAFCFEGSWRLKRVFGSNRVLLLGIFKLFLLWNNFSQAK